MKRPEESLHRAVVCYLKVACPELVWFHVPNGGRRSKAEAGIFKALGVKPGVADLAFVLPGGRAAFIELKAEGAYQTPDQKTWGRQVQSAGALYAVCRSMNDVYDTLFEWGVALKARAA